MAPVINAQPAPTTVAIVQETAVVPATRLPRKRWLIFAAVGIYVSYRVYKWVKQLTQETIETWTKVQENVKEILSSTPDEGFSPVEIILGMAMLKTYYRSERPSGGDRVVSVAFQKICIRHMRYAAAAYGWKVVNGLLYDNKESLVNSTLTGERRDEINMQILQAHTGIKEEDVLLAQWSSGVNVFDPACYVAVDQAERTIVVAIRGTLNISDVLTDLACNYVPFQGGVTHEGFLKCAQRKYEQTWTHVLAAVQRFPGYDVTIVGHSLGAGTAMLLALIYAEKHPALRMHCYAFAPPGTLDITTANNWRVKALVSSFVFRDDLVCRLSYGHVTDLKHTARWLMDQMDPQSSTLMHVATGQLLEVAKMGPSVIETRLHDIVKHKPIDMRNFHLLPAEKIYVPGSVYYIEPITTDQRTGICYKMTRSKPEQFSKIVLSDSMLVDHFPPSYEKALEGCVPLKDRPVYPDSANVAVTV